MHNYVTVLLKSNDTSKMLQYICGIPLKILNISAFAYSKKYPSEGEHCDDFCCTN